MTSTSGNRSPNREGRKSFSATGRRHPEHIINSAMLSTSLSFSPRSQPHVTARPAQGIRGDMEDYDHILPTDFPGPSDPDTTEALAGIDADATEDEGDFLPEGQDDVQGVQPVSSSHSKGKVVTSGMSEGEKKDRQKLQNRKAAERSRHKKRQEQ